MNCELLKLRMTQQVRWFRRLVVELVHPRQLVQVENADLLL